MRSSHKDLLSIDILKLQMTLYGNCPCEIPLAIDSHGESLLGCVAFARLDSPVGLPGIDPRGLAEQYRLRCCLPTRNSYPKGGAFLTTLSIDSNWVYPVRRAPPVAVVRARLMSTHNRVA